MSKFIPIETAEKIIETLWNVMDTEWSGAKEARKKCEELIEKNIIYLDRNLEQERMIADYINKVTNGAWPSYDEFVRQQNKQ